MSQHFMLLPSLACQASCAYCFGPNRGPIMAADVLDATVEWLAAIAPDDKLDLTFHGGEPLLAGYEWYARALPLLRRRFGQRIKLAVQSNLWRLDDALCELFREYQVSLGTSLDGPEAINDRQRGAGYFVQTMRGIETARRHGLDVGVICTFTRLSAPHDREVLDFFISRSLNFSVHEAVATLNTPPEDALALTPAEHADLFARLFEAYLDNITRVRISTFDAMAKGISAGCGSLCTFTNCLGHYLTVGPRGEIYSCNRFAQHPEWQLGAVQTMPDRETLSQTAAWMRLQAREEATRAACGDCAHFAYCQGGCAYNALTGGHDARDPHCPAYKRLFDVITDRALAEVFSDENLEAVIHAAPRPATDKTSPLLRKGKVVQLMRGGAHPQETARAAREVVAAVALAVSDSPEEALHKLDRAGVITRPELALQSLRELRRRLDTQSQQGLLNAYLHVTYACNLHCAHCYASAGPGPSPALAVDDVVRLTYAARDAGFRKVVITGGEPLLHPHRDALLDALSALRDAVKPMQTVLRTNLAAPLSPTLAERLRRCADQIVVSVDGDEASHDARRGAGTYARTVENLRALAQARTSSGLRPPQLVGEGRTPQLVEGRGEVVIAATLTAAQTAGPEGDAVCALAEELGIGARFKPVLPLGRAAERDFAPEAYTSLDDESDVLARQAGPHSTCGLGMNLYIAPDGLCYPCYALMGARHTLGNALDDLAAVLTRNDAYRRVTVDSNRQCRACALRYVCGGFCRAWGSSDDPDAPPMDCAALYARARGLLLSALDTLGMTMAQWEVTGLSLPNES